MTFPPQLIPDSQKNDEWCRNCMNAAIKDVEMMRPRAMELLMYQIYYGAQDEADYEYLTGSDDFRMPAKVRFLPISKPFFDILVSTEQSRPFQPEVYAVDNGSIDEKARMMAEDVVGRVISRIGERQQRVAIMKQRLQLAQQQMQQAGQDPSAAPPMLQMEQRLREMSAEVERSESVLGSEVEELERQYKFKPQTHNERQMSNGMEFLIAQYDLQSMFSKGFEDLLCVDQEIYKIENVYEGQDPRVRRVNPMNVYYSADADNEWLDTAGRIVEVRTMSTTSAIDMFGSRMKPDDLAQLKDRCHTTGWGYYYNPNNFNALPYGNVDACNTGLYTGNGFGTQDTVMVYNVEWKSVKKLMLKKSESKKYPGITFTHLITDEKELRDGDRLEVRYITEYWEGVRIGGNIFVDMQRKPFQFRDMDGLGTSYSSYIGFAYNGVDRRPYSRVMAVKDVQILYNLVYYQVELLMALGGIKGIIMDKAQIPKSMSMKEWFQWLKSGLGLIDTSPDPDNPGARRPTFNQFQNYDMSFGNAIAQLHGVMDKLEAMMGTIIGIPPQRRGEISSNDQVGTNKQAIIQSNITTEVIFNKHERIRNRVMERMMMAASRAWRNGKRGSYVLGRMGQKMLDIAAGQMDNASFKLHWGQPGHEKMVMDMALQAANMSYQSGTSSLSQLLMMYNANNLREMQETVLYLEGIAMKRAEAGAQAEAQREQENEKVKADLELMLKKQMTDAEQMKAQIDMKRLELEQQKGQMDNQTKLQVAQMQAGSQANVANINAGTEREWMAKETRDTDIDARLRQMEMLMDGLANLSGSVSSPGSKASTPSKAA